MSNTETGSIVIETRFGIEVAPCIPEPVRDTAGRGHEIASTVSDEN